MQRTPTQSSEGYHPTDLQPHEPATRPRRNLLVGSALILTGVLLLGSAIGNSNSTFEQEWTNTNAIVLQAGNADIRVESGQSRTIQVRVESRGLIGETAIDASESGGVVTIDGPQNNRFCVVCRRPTLYIVQIPQGIDATLTTLSGDITIRGADGAFTATTVNGDIDVEDSGGTLTASTTNGDLNVQESRLDRISFEAVNGDVQVEELTGAGVFKTFNGDIDASLAGATIQIETINGDIDVEGALGAGSSRVSTERGDVDVTIADTAGVEFSATTQFGDIDMEGFGDTQREGQRATARVGDGSSALDIVSTSGDISVEYE